MSAEGVVAALDTAEGRGALRQLMVRVDREGGGRLAALSPSERARVWSKSLRGLAATPEWAALRDARGLGELSFAVVSPRAARRLGGEVARSPTPAERARSPTPAAATGTDAADAAAVPAVPAPPAPIDPVALRAAVRAVNATPAPDCDEGAARRTRLLWLEAAVADAVAKAKADADAEAEAEADADADADAGTV